MSPELSRRSLLAAGLTAVGGGLVAGGLTGLEAAETTAAAAPLKGAVTLESLGNLLSALGLKAARTESRFDFAFAAKHDEEWELSMSVVLSTDAKTIWIMAWLDECPQSAVDVPRTALLRLLADNDRMGNGQFFAYVSSNRRFVLQRVIQNESITSALLRESLVELGKTVANTYAHWSVANWKQLGTPGSSGSEAAAPAEATASAAQNGKPAATKSGLPAASNKSAAPAANSKSVITPTNQTTKSSPGAARK